MKTFEERTKTTGNRDFSLELLRAFSCLMVVGVHFVQHFTVPGKLGMFLEKGSTGVGFFFILSGFLAYRSLDRADGVIKYWIKRAVHILPLYFIVLIFYFILYALSGNIPEDSSGLYWIRYILLINLWVPSNNDFWVNLGALWSISVFVLFYLLAPIIYKLIRRYYTSWIGVVVSYVIFKVTEGFGTGRLPIRYMFYFMLGIMLDLAIREGREFGTGVLISAVLVFCFLADTGEAIVSPMLACLFILVTSGRKEKLSDNNVLKKAVCFIA
nr:acyltransferase [Lachnospiraceae bacterium]